MIDQLKDLIRDNAQEAIFNNSDVPNNKNEEAVDAASHSITDVLKDKVSSGQLKDILSGGKDAAESNLSTDIMQNFSGKLKGLGIDEGISQNIAKSVIPIVISKVLGQGKGSADLGLEQILSQVGGGNFDLSSLGKLLGGSGKDSKGSLGDIMGKAKDLF